MEDSKFNKQALVKRLSTLTGSVGIIKVGGVSETEISEAKDRVDDALNATRAALEEGFIPGGGLSLLKAGQKAYK